MFDNDGDAAAAASNDRGTEDTTILLKLLSDIKQSAADTRKVVSGLLHELKDAKSENDQSEGISFLQLKNRLLASYTSDLGFLMLKKCSGKGLTGEAAVERLVETRTVLEKIRPIDQKLRYQVDKLVNIAENGTVDQNDPLRYKPNPEGLTSKLDEGSSDEEESAATDPSSSQKFKAPMNVPQYYNEGKSNDAAADNLQQQEKSQKRTISKAIMDSIKEQYLDTPDEVSHKSDVMKKKFIDDEREKIRLEEEHFIGMLVTKADRVRRKQMMTMTSIGDDITNFGRSVYDDKSTPTQFTKSAKKRKHSAAGHSKKKGGLSKKYKKR